MSCSCQRPRWKGAACVPSIVSCSNAMPAWLVASSSMPEAASAGLTALLPLLPAADSDEDTAELELVRKRALSPGGQEGPNAKRQKVGSSCLTSASLEIS